MKEYIITTEKGANQQLHELTRCRDCKWYEADHRFCHKTKSVTLTSNWDIEIYHKTSPEGFCEKAERKDNDTR